MYVSCVNFDHENGKKMPVFSDLNRTSKLKMQEGAYKNSGSGLYGVYC